MKQSGVKSYVKSTPFKIITIKNRKHSTSLKVCTLGSQPGAKGLSEPESFVHQNSPLGSPKVWLFYLWSLPYPCKGERWRHTAVATVLFLQLNILLHIICFQQTEAYKFSRHTPLKLLFPRQCSLIFHRAPSIHPPVKKSTFTREFPSVLQVTLRVCFMNSLYGFFYLVCKL